MGEVVEAVTEEVEVVTRRVEGETDTETVSGGVESETDTETEAGGIETEMGIETVSGGVEASSLGVESKGGEGGDIETMSDETVSPDNNVC